MKPGLAQSIAEILNSEQIERLLATVNDFSAEQLNWASGFLAGFAAAGRRGASGPQPTPILAAVSAEPARTLTIVYGSQTGNGKKLAQLLHAKARELELPARLVNMGELQPRQFSKEHFILIVVSTHGDGDPPDAAEALIEYLKSAKAPRLEHLHYGVLALGDSSYAQFCKTGRDFDERLQALGAHPWLPVMECDLDYETTAPVWMDAVLGQAAPALAVQAAPRVNVGSPARATAVVAGETASLHAVKVLTNQRITGRHSSKDVRHVELAIDGASLDYQPGDSLAVVAHNPAPVVDELLALKGWDEQAMVQLGDSRLSLREALTTKVELTLLSRQFIAGYQGLTKNAELGALLADAQRSRLAAYLQDRQVADVLRAAPGEFSPDDFLRCLRPLARRQYSLASSLLANSDEAHLTVAVVRYARDTRLRLGAASNFLAECTPGTRVEVQVETNENFRLPDDDDTPIIMVGPGTGVAPFRAFVEERGARGARGRNWLFFGERTFGEDFLYQIEWQRHLRDGILTRMDVAFSRDQDRKIYVQQRLLERAQEVYAWLEEGAYFYVCGDAKQMAKDVHAALRQIIIAAGQRSEEDADEYVSRLKRDGRYRRDVY